MKFWLFYRRVEAKIHKNLHTLCCPGSIFRPRHRAKRGFSCAPLKYYCYTDLQSGMLSCTQGPKFNSIHYPFSIWLQVQRVRDGANQCIQEFKANLQLTTSQVEKFVGEKETALTLLDDTHIAGEFLKSRTHPTEVIRKFNKMTAEINERLADESLEQTHKIYPVFLNKGVSLFSEYFPEKI